MKKILILIFILIFVIGCEKVNLNNDLEKNNDNTEKEIELSDKYTFCYIGIPSNHISWSFYYDIDYNMVKEFSLISKTYDTLEEATLEEVLELASCEKVKENFSCTVFRSNTTVDKGITNYKPDYTYHEKITELESGNVKCSEEYIEN